MVTRDERIKQVDKLHLAKSDLIDKNHSCAARLVERVILVLGSSEPIGWSPGDIKLLNIARSESKSYHLYAVDRTIKEVASFMNNERP